MAEGLDVSTWSATLTAQRVAGSHRVPHRDGAPEGCRTARPARHGLN